MAIRTNVRDFVMFMKCRMHEFIADKQRNTIILDFIGYGYTTNRANIRLTSLFVSALFARAKMTKTVNASTFHY